VDDHEALRFTDLALFNRSLADWLGVLRRRASAPLPRPAISAILAYRNINPSAKGTGLIHRIDKAGGSPQHRHPWAYRERTMPHQIIQLKDEEIQMLRRELELLMGERELLLRIAGAAAAFVAELDTQSLPEETWEAAELLAELLNGIPEETLREALEAVKAHIVSDGAQQHL
jgi:hypothetical protein